MLITVTFAILLSTSATRSEPDRNFRIVGGHPARPNQFPHVVALILYLQEGHSFCGGSIIHQNFVLTAAHCLVSSKASKIEQLNVRLINIKD